MTPWPNKRMRRQSELPRQRLEAGWGRARGMVPPLGILPDLFDPSILFANGEQGAWYDPSDLTTLFQDAAGTVPVTEDGQPVGLMLDKSGNGNHLLQNSTALKPIYRTDGTLRWLAFDGADDILVNEAMPAMSSGTVTFGQRMTSPSGAIRVLFELATYPLTVGRIGALYPRRTDGRRAGNSGGATLAEAETPVSVLGTATVSTVLGSIADDLAVLRENGAVVGSASTDQGAGTYGPILYIGNRYNSNLPYHGNVYGFVLREGVLSPSELGAVESWMSTKTGVTL